MDGQTVKELVESYLKRTDVLHYEASQAGKWIVYGPARKRGRKILCEKSGSFGEIIENVCLTLEFYHTKNLFVAPYIPEGFRIIKPTDKDNGLVLKLAMR